MQDLFNRKISEKSYPHPRNTQRCFFYYYLICVVRLDGMIYCRQHVSWADPGFRKGRSVQILQRFVFAWCLGATREGSCPPPPQPPLEPSLTEFALRQNPRQNPSYRINMILSDLRLYLNCFFLCLLTFYKCSSVTLLQTFLTFILYRMIQSHNIKLTGR